MGTLVLVGTVVDFNIRYLGQRPQSERKGELKNNIRMT